MTPKVTVIMPSLNVKPYIKECVKSVMNQTLKELEIICIDAGSTDGTYEVLQDFALRDQRIRLIHTDKKSYGYQINQGLQLASAEYIGIVETDDYIEPQMYERLFNIIDSEKVDYVKSEFDSFKVLKSGKRVFSTFKSYGKSELYNQKICPREFREVFLADSSIWRGIYRKSFLIEHGIKLSETSGAAYQDIGFVIQVIALAEKVIYVPESYYRYRLQRENSSSYSERALYNCYYEYSRLMTFIEKALKYKENKIMESYYIRMASSFVSEYKKVLIGLDFCIDSENLSEPYKWFSEQLEHAIRSGFLTEDGVIQSVWRELQELLENEKSFAEKEYKRICKKEANDKKIIEELLEKAVIIFGSGSWGKKALIWLEQFNIDIVAFCDNDQKIWGQTIADIPIYSLEQSVSEYPFAYYIIASKNCALEMQQQLLDIGIDEAQLKIYLC